MEFIHKVPWWDLTEEDQVRILGWMIAKQNLNLMGITTSNVTISEIARYINGKPEISKSNAEILNYLEG